MQKSAKIALIAVVAVVVLGGAGFYWFFLKSDNPTEVTLRDRSSESTTVPPGGAKTSADGTWKVQQDQAVFVGYRMMELFGGETIKKEAVGRTGAVTGTMTIAGQQVTSVDITADMTQLKSDQSRRDNFIKGKGLETDKFTQATFKTTAPIQLPSAPELGKTMTVNATGDLTLHGKTKSVTVPLEAVWNGNTIDVSGKLDIQIADYEIEKIQIATVTVDAEGKLEIALSFVPDGGSAGGSGQASTTTAKAGGASAPSTTAASGGGGANPSTTKAPASGGAGGANYPTTTKAPSGGGGQYPRSYR